MKETTETAGPRSYLLGLALAYLAGMEIRPDPCSAGNRYTMASPRIQALLDKEDKSWKTWTTSHQTGNP